MAGLTLARNALGHEGAALEEASGVLNNWRAAHSFPLNTLQTGLRKRAAGVCNTAIVSQRLKRTPSTIAKLRRFRSMKLATMQDIGGCRAVVDSVEQVEILRASHRRSRMKHRLVREDDYIASPKGSGYRGVHMVYRYRSDRNDTYNGLLIEVQLRSKLQHAWATAVETAGAFLGQALKSSEGEAMWLQFFALASSFLAHRETGPMVPGTPTSEGSLHSQLRRCGSKLNVVERMREYRVLIKEIPDLATGPGDHYFLLERRPDEGKTYIQTYSRRDLGRATEDYARSETRVAGVLGGDTVLVSVGSIKALRRAYPNYWLDTKAFLQALHPILQ